MTDEEKKAINRIYDVTHQVNSSHVDYIDIDNICTEENELDSCEGFCKAIDIILNLIEKQETDYETCMDYADTLNRDIGELLLKIEKQEKLINLMTEHIYKGCDFDNRIKTKQDIIEYFEKKVGEEE